MGVCFNRLTVNMADTDTLLRVLAKHVHVCMHEGDLANRVWCVCVCVRLRYFQLLNVAACTIDMIDTWTI